MKSGVERDEEFLRSGKEAGIYVQNWRRCTLTSSGHVVFVKIDGADLNRLVSTTSYSQN